MKEKSQMVMSEHNNAVMIPLNLEQINQLILENAYDLIAIHKIKDLSYKYVNPATIKLLGYSEEELLNKSAIEFIHPYDIDRIIKSIRKKMFTGYGQDGFRYLKKDGTYIWLEITGSLLNQDNNDGDMVIISRDITDRKKIAEELEAKVQERTAELQKNSKKLKDIIKKQKDTEKELRKSENYYRTIFENTGTATVIVDKNLKISASNMRTEQLTGYKTENLIGLNPFDKFVTPKCLQTVEENYHLRKVDPANAPQNYELECHDINGVIKNVVMNVKPVPESEERFRTLFEKAPIGIAMNRDGITLFVNQAYLKMHGYDDDNEIIGSLAVEQVAPSCREEIIDRIRQRAVAGGFISEHETLGQRRNGAIFPVIVQVNTVGFADGNTNILFFTDISKQKNTEEKLRYQVEAHRILLEISSKFVIIDISNINEVIDDVLKTIGEFTQSDRCYVFLFSENGDTISNTHEWCANGIKSEAENKQNFPIVKFPLLMSKLRMNEKIIIHNLPELSDELIDEYSGSIVKTIEPL